MGAIPTPTDDSAIFGLDTTWFADPDGSWARGQGPDARAKSGILTRVSDPPVDGDDAELIARAAKAMRRRTVDDLEWQFFSQPRPTWRSPFNDADVPLIGGLPRPSGALYAFFGGDHPCTMIIGRRNVSALYYHRQHRLFINKNKDMSSGRSMLKQLLRVLLRDRDRTAAYLAQGTSGRLRRCLMIGDPRPSHYLSQTVGYHALTVIPRLAEFRAVAGELAILRDECVIDPFVLFPELDALPRLEVEMADLGDIAFDQGLLCQRFIRHGSDNDFSAIRAFFDARSRDRLPLDREFRVWVTLDVEKMRFQNQVEAVAAAIDHLNEFAKDQGRKLIVLWDGWTVRGGRKTEKDRTVIARAEEIIDLIRRVTRHHFDHSAMFDLRMLDKLSMGQAADIALASYGTASTLANVLMKVPCVAYGVADFIQCGEYVDPSNAVVLTEPEVTRVGDASLKYDGQCFTVPVDTLLDALDRLVGGKSGASPAAVAMQFAA